MSPDANGKIQSIEEIFFFFFFYGFEIRTTSINISFILRSFHPTDLHSTMALFRTRSSLHQAQKIHSLLLNQLFIFFSLSVPHAKSIYFNFPSFQPNECNLTFQGDAYADTEGLQITKNTRTRLVNNSVGCASFHKQVCLWDNSTGGLQTSSLTSPLSFKLLEILEVLYCISQ